MADQRIALVTGASSGIGFATASLFAERGYRTFGTSRDPERKGCPKGVEMVKLDVDSDDSARAAIDVVASKGPIQVLVNNIRLGGGNVARGSAASSRDEFLGGGADDQACITWHA
jgi:NAD(P)-dependent dehydrogenase (short-subunit alcohol dehydrogenase family)